MGPVGSAAGAFMPVVKVYREAWSARDVDVRTRVAAVSILLPFRAGWPNTNVALPLVVVGVAAAALGNRAGGRGGRGLVEFFLTVPYERFTIRSTADVTTFMLLLLVGVAASQLAAYARRMKVITIGVARTRRRPG